MVIGHTLDGKRVPAEHLLVGIKDTYGSTGVWWDSVPVCNTAKLSIKLLRRAFRAMSANVDRHEIRFVNWEEYDRIMNPPVNLLSQRFLGVR